MIRCDHGVEGAAHGPDEHGVGRERSADPRLERDGSQQDVILAAEAPSIAGMRIKGAQGDARLVDPEPLREARACDVGGLQDRLTGHGPRYVAQRDVGRRQDDAKPV